MPPTAAIVIPTRGRPAYLDVALASIRPQALAAGAEVLVVDDGPDAGTRAVAERHGARYVLPPGGRHGLNIARNAGIAATDAGLLVFTDDDVAVWDGWLPALLEAAADLPDDVGVLTGPIRARVEDHRFPRCGRENGPGHRAGLRPARHRRAARLGREPRDPPQRAGPRRPVRPRALRRRGRGGVGAALARVRRAHPLHRRRGRRPPPRRGRRAAALALPRRPGPRARGARV